MKLCVRVLACLFHVDGAVLAEDCEWVLHILSLLDALCKRYESCQ